MRNSHLIIYLVILCCAGCVSLNNKEKPPSSRKKISAPQLYEAKFPHAPHLSSGTNAECVSCHPSQPDGSYVTAFKCQICHNREKQILADVGEIEHKVLFEPFRHDAHLNNKEQCIDCHQMDLDGQEDELLAQKISLETQQNGAEITFDNCKQCHLTHKTDLPHYQGGDDCVKCHLQKDVTVKTKTHERSSFTHVSHIPDPDPQNWQPDHCLPCHTGILNSAPSVKTDLDKCDVCHPQTAGNTEKNIPWNVEWKTKSATRFVFRHSSHLANGESCNQCHNIADGKINFKYSGHTGCVVCHQEWAVPSHGNLDNCWKCHQEKEPSKMVMVTVTRNKMGDITFPHKGEAYTQKHHFGPECIKCHVQPQPIAPVSTGKPFIHNQHLAGINSEQKRNQYCLTCHNHITQNNKPADLEIFSKINRCKECHFGIQPSFQSLQQTFQRPLFSHREHSSIVADCIGCHSIDGNETGKSEDSCRSCHDHRNQKDVTNKQLDKCFHCHLSSQLWEPSGETQRRIMKVLGASSETYKHERSGKCTLCHKTDYSKISRPGIKKMMRRDDPHPSTLSPKTCASCHIKYRKK